MELPMMLILLPSLTSSSLIFTFKIAKFLTQIVPFSRKQRIELALHHSCKSANRSFQGSCFKFIKYSCRLFLPLARHSGYSFQLGESNTQFRCLRVSKANAGTAAKGACPFFLLLRRILLIKQWVLSTSFYLNNTIARSLATFLVFYGGRDRNAKRIE